MNLAADLGRILTAQREHVLGKSRRALAQEAGVSDVALLNIEHGRTNPTLDRVEKLAAIYGVELAVIPSGGEVAALVGTPAARNQ